MKMLMLTERVCGSVLLTMRRPFSRTVLSNMKVPEVYGTRATSARRNAQVSAAHQGVGEQLLAGA